MANQNVSSASQALKDLNATHPEKVALLGELLAGIKDDHALACIECLVGTQRAILYLSQQKQVLQI